MSLDFSHLSLVEWMLFFFGICTLNAIGFYFYYKHLPHSEFVSTRITKLSHIGKGDIEEQKTNLPFLERIIIMTANLLRPIFTKYRKQAAEDTLKAKLVRSGDNATDPVQFWAKKILFTITALIIGSVLKNTNFLIIGVIIGFFYSDLQLKQKVQKRQNKLRNDLPNFIDLLATTASSVPNLDEAIRKVCDRFDSELSNEFRIVLSEISTGKRRRDALSEMAARTGVSEIRSLVSQINQSEVFGTPVQRTLEDQAVKLRKIKRDLAEKKAAAASNYLIMPSFFLLITILIVVMGPTIVQLSSSGMGG